jgi:hypothetical protein
MPTLSFDKRKAAKPVAVKTDTRLRILSSAALGFLWRVPSAQAHGPLFRVCRTTLATSKRTNLDPGKLSLAEFYPDICQTVQRSKTSVVISFY